MTLSSHKGFLTAAALIVFTLTAYAQDERDAARFSMLQPQGTARSIGFGSALGSIGGDFTSLSVNPAGIGIYRRSEITFTPSLTFSHTNADYTGHTDADNGTHFAISNIGLVTTQVMTGRRAKRTGWTSFSFGIGLTRLADFSRYYSYAGQNTSSSGSFVFEANANKYGTDQVQSPYGYLGYQTYLINPDSGGTFYSVVNPTANAPVSQQTRVSEYGGIKELGITLGGSYQERLMIGATLGFPIVRYTRNKSFTERDVNNTMANFDNFTYNEELKTTGGGVNLKLGFIMKPNDMVRFGLAIHTPTYLALTDIQDQDMTTNTESYQGTVNVALPTNQYDYSLTTPWRAVASATAFLGGFGFITADLEYVDYASARFNFDDKTYQHAVNDVIKQNLQGALNGRAGLELRFDNFQLRGGFGYYGNPYKNTNDGSGRLDFSAGLGFRFTNTFIDLGFVHHQYSSTEQPYTLPDTDKPGSLYYQLMVPSAKLNTGNNNAVVTFGFKL